MAKSTVHNVRYAGMASCVPRNVISNLLDCRPEQRAERERLVRNIGIELRPKAPEWQCFSDLAFEAAQSLIEQLQWSRGEIDALIVLTQSPDYVAPATAIILQDRLGLSHSTIAFDVNLGCSGYPFGLHLLSSMISAGGVKKALLLVGERSSQVGNPIFSDAATATALEFDPTAAPMYFDLNSDGSGHKSIIFPVGGHREPVALKHLIEGRERTIDIELDGTAVLSFSTQRVPPAVEMLLDYAQVDKSEVDYFLFHQANRMINETIRKKLDLPPEKVPSSLRDFGNSSSASIPLTMTARINRELASAPHRLLMCGFGIGLSWGTCLVDVRDACFPDLIKA
ncbi:ketoacyl-ACP synthase III [Pseudomonas putida]